MRGFAAKQNHLVLRGSELACNQLQELALQAGEIGIHAFELAARKAAQAHRRHRLGAVVVFVRVAKT